MLQAKTNYIKFCDINLSILSTTPLGKIKREKNETASLFFKIAMGIQNIVRNNESPCT